MSHRGDLTERTFLLPLLIAERPHSQRELARYFHVHTKTIKRDLDILGRAHPIVSYREGREVHYTYLEGYKYHPPELTPSELAALLLAQNSIAATTLTTAGAPFADFGRSLLEKVRTAMQPVMRQRLDALAGVLGSATVSAKDFTAHTRTIDQLISAAVDQRRVLLKYYTLARGVLTERKVDPYSLYFDPDGATLKLVAFDHLRDRLTPFSIDHIRSIEETGERFIRPENFDLREYLIQNCFNGIHGDPITVRLRAYGVTARVFAERQFHPSQRVIDEINERSTGTADKVRSNARNAASEETITIELRVAGGRGLVRFILSWAPDVEVIEPTELREEVDEAHRLALLRQGEHE